MSGAASQRIPALKPPPAGGLPVAPLLQRKCACGAAKSPPGESCEECRRGAPALQRFPLSSSDRETRRPAVDDSGVLEALRSPGQSLDAGARAFLEPRFGHSFSDVRVHLDATAARSARAMGAAAYTVGRDIVFASGRYDPHGRDGRRLLAHELAHTIQQGDSRAAPAPGAGMQVGGPDTALERAADQAAEAAVAERWPARPAALAPAAPAALLQRQAAGGDEPDWHPDFPGCSNAHSRRLDFLLLLAQALVTGAILSLEDELEPSPSGIITRARSALLHNFHTEDAKDIKTILARFERILDRLEQGPRNVRCLDDKKCDAVCEGRGAPFACAGPGVPITICSGVFDATKDPFYAVVLIHEAAHQVGSPFHTYDPAHRKAVPDQRQLALRSANSYANFAEDVSAGGTGSINYHRR